MKAIHKNVTIKMNARETQSRGGIAIPIQAQEPTTEGVITSIGNQVEGVQVGETVGYPSHLGTRIESRGEDYLIIDHTKLLYVRR